MSLSLADLVNDRRTITVDYLDHQVKVVYKPSAYTGEVAMQLGVMSTWEFVVKVVESWDVLDGDTPVAINEANVNGLPIRFLRMVASSIIEDVSLGEAESS